MNDGRPLSKSGLRKRLQRRRQCDSATWDKEKKLKAEERQEKQKEKQEKRTHRETQRKEHQHQQKVYQEKITKQETQSIGDEEEEEEEEEDEDEEDEKEEDDDDDATGNAALPSIPQIPAADHSSVQVGGMWSFEARCDLRQRIAVMDSFKLASVLRIVYPHEPIRGGQAYTVDLEDVDDSVCDALAHLLGMPPRGAPPSALPAQHLRHSQTDAPSSQAAQGARGTAAAASAAAAARRDRE